MKNRKGAYTRNQSYVVNPFVSREQQKACYAKDDPNWDCHAWSHDTEGERKKKTPLRKGTTGNISARKRRRYVSNAKKAKLTKLDPSRTSTLRRAFINRIRKRFALLKGRIVALIVKENALGLTDNSNPEGCNQYTGPGCSTSGERPPDKPTAQEFGEWLDKGWSYGEKGWEPPQEEVKSTATGEIAQEVHEKAKEQLSDRALALIASAHDWEEFKPWNLSEEEIKSNPPLGFRYETKGHGEEARFEGGRIHLSSKFFQPPMSNHEEARKHVIYHELGHQLADTMVSDGTSFQLHDAGVIPKKHDLGSGTGGGHGDEEALADAYALMHTDPGFLQKNHPQLVKPVVDRARALGMPIPKGLTINEGWITLESGQHVFIDKDGSFQFGGPRDGGRTSDERGRGSDGSGATRPSGRMEGEAAQPSATGTDQGGERDTQPAGEGTIPRLPATKEEATKKIDRYENFFRAKGLHQAADWMNKLKEHVNEVGTDAALKSLGEEIKGKGEKAQYGGHNLEENHDAAFIRGYLDRNGISLIHGSKPEGELRAISTVTPSSDAEGLKSRGDSKDFFPTLQTLRDKLHESQVLPGLEKSEDLGKLMGKEFGSKVDRFSPEVVKKLNETYGDGKWIVKSYGDEAYAGYGIFFPQYAQKIQEDARNTIWTAGGHLDKYGFKIARDKDGKAAGLIHETGDHYQFGSKEYHDTIHGDARHWGDRVAAAAPNEHGAQIPEGKFMAQPAFPVVGISNEERAAGVTFKTGQEGRVHIVTRNGVAEIIPHSTWLKKEPLPVVFENDDTRAMAKAALDAINALPHTERQGQLYAPDIVKTKDGYRVVEANPANEAGASGYLQDNPMIIDSYVSHLTGREPAHVAFARKLLTSSKGKTRNANPEGCNQYTGPGCGTGGAVRDVVHETNHDAADVLITQGVRPDFKREKHVDEQTQGTMGSGLDRGVYVGTEKSFSKGSLGNVRLHMKVGEHALDVPTEAKRLGYEKGKEVAGQSSLDWVLGNENGAVTVGEIHPSSIHKVEVYEGGKWKEMTPEEYKASRDIAAVPRLPGMKEYEDTLRKNADKWGLQERHIQQSLTDYNRAPLADKHYLAQDAGLIKNVFCPTGAGGGVDASCSPGGEGSAGSGSATGAGSDSFSPKDEATKGAFAKAKDTLSRWGGKVNSLVDRVPVVGKVKAGMQKAMGVVKDKLASRYGDRAAGIIMASGSVGGYGVMALAIKTVGFTLPVVTDVISIAAHVAVAEGMYQLGILKGKGKPTANAEELSAGQMARIGYRTWHELADTFTTLLREHKEELEKGLKEEKEEDWKGLTKNTRWIFSSLPEKLRSFGQWIIGQVKDIFTNPTEEQAWDEYIAQGYRKGAGRAFDEVRSRERILSEQSQERLDFYRGSREEFLRSSFGQPVQRERLEILAQRTFDELEGVTDDMSTKLGRTLADGLVQGMHPREIARDLVEEVDISLNRAETVAQTEIMRAHAEGQLSALENLGVKEVGVAVEWSIADEGACEACSDLEGVVLDLDEARGMLPRHPRCRCVWIPANVGEDDDNQKRSADEIEEAAARSATSMGDDFELDVSMRRPQSILNASSNFYNAVTLPKEAWIDWNPLDLFSQFMVGNNDPTVNVFCPTGIGGGVDPSCSVGQGGTSMESGSKGSESKGVDKSKFIGAKVGKAEHVHAAKVEAEIAQVLGGQVTSLEGGVYAPRDVTVPAKNGSHELEIKSLLKGEKQGISVHPDALVRKADFMQQCAGCTYHTVVVDERAQYEGGQYKDNYSGNRMYYKRGSGRYSLSQMHPVKDAKELRKLLNTPNHQLPEKAQGTLPTGKELEKLREEAKKAHASRLAKDRARKARLKEEKAAKQ